MSSGCCGPQCQIANCSKTRGVHPALVMLCNFGLAGYLENTKNLVHNSQRLDLDKFDHKRIENNEFHPRHPDSKSECAPHSAN